MYSLIYVMEDERRSENADRPVLSEIELYFITNTGFCIINYI
jgi:hypothetical protein